ncbi:bifunctional 4-hydroxy-2-oxoglutarate aldolase/2-dehydro-3-deoxy-phosphogluconate aldolase [Thermospira aquatica]|uniref:Bifunctional 4-hydroxy-2-oxoglutarate aldolase/2-dehydro-3-deoxy-phosphogluconate aldolase n=1 Tax=Thermospira aquatica TaxID=2828656 RepID=A0AAX3BCU9_9SPIR|nr:bifunctional 4-hydroxy-2-oxoglutarate aldolase/2-dehydro-3-deoxy-phosphogluconate aldolase [Thermospira aquatica]URA10077.1 bifunctional 4-hydroxy-2-oxoglutarate aldolase/2-dehydro-3-deoxy-phosphogluconate aldolase [Thermospira aquatica]
MANAKDVVSLLKNERILPIVRGIEAEYALDLARATFNSGCKIMEFTLSIPGILRQVARVKETFPDMYIGVGTVLTKEQAKEVVKLGVDFVVSPILNREIADEVKKANKMLVLAGLTPTELYEAYRLGSDVVKLFPAREMNPSYVRELRGPLPELEILATGGLSLIMAIEYIAAGAVAVGLGSTLYKKELIVQKKFDQITEIIENAYTRIKMVKL